MQRRADLDCVRRDERRSSGGGEDTGGGAMATSLLGQGEEETAQLSDRIGSAAIKTPLPKLEDPLVNLTEFSEGDASTEAGDAVAVLTCLEASFVFLFDDGGEILHIDGQSATPVKTGVVFGVRILSALEDLLERDQAGFAALGSLGQSRPPPVFRFFDQTGPDGI